MKDAYSNLLGEYVDARDVDHDDVLGFQIVCPVCREEIFKVARETEERTISFFSHYQASPAVIVAECERRVGSLSDSEKASASAISRNQNLAMFRSVVRDALAILPIAGHPFNEVEARKVHVMHDMIGPDIREMVAQWGPSGFLRDLVHSNDKAIAAVGHVNLTSFGMSFRNRIAADLVRTIFASGSGKTIAHMIARAHTVAFRLKGMSPNGMVTFDMRSRSRKLADCEEIKEAHSRPSHRSSRVTAYTVLDAMLRELHRLPYLKMIENAQSKRRPLEGISIIDFLPDLEDDQPDINYVPKQGVIMQTNPMPERLK